MEGFKLTFEIDKSVDEIRIIGEDFFKYNNLSYIIIYKNKKINDLREFISIKHIKEEKFKIKIIFIEKVNNKSFMFKDCTSLLRVSKIEKIKNTKKYEPKIIKNSVIINDYFYYDDLYEMSKIQENNINYKEKDIYYNDKSFYDEISLIPKKDEELSESLVRCWKNIELYPKNISLSGLFYNCKKLESLPDISEWDLTDVIDLSLLFYNCSKLESLPDLSKWNTSKVEDMSQLFYNCSKLESLPDLSKWNTSNVKYMNGLFFNCSALKSLPDLSKWNINNVIDISLIFSNCSNLKSLPDISEWDTSNIIDMNGLFSNCSSLLILPNIFKWNTCNVTNMDSMFANCYSLLYLPDISNWKTENVIKMNEMFLNCKSLLSLPDLSNWNMSNVESKDLMFYNCSSLTDIQKVSKKMNIDEEPLNSILMFMNVPNLYTYKDIYNIISKK